MKTNRKAIANQSGNLPAASDLKRLARWYRLRLTLAYASTRSSDDNTDPEDLKDDISSLFDDEDTALKRRRTQQRTRRNRAALTRITPAAKRTRRQLLGRLRGLQTRLGLNALDQELLLLGAATTWDRQLWGWCDEISVLGKNAEPASFASALDVREAELKDCLRANGRLSACGLLKSEDYSNDLTDGFTPDITDTFKKADNGRKECSCRSERSTAQSSSKVPLSRLAIPV